MICRIKKKTTEKDETELEKQNRKNTDAGTELDGRHRKKTDRGTKSRTTGTKREGMTVNNTKRHKKKGALYLFSFSKVFLKFVETEAKFEGDRVRLEEI